MSSPESFKGTLRFEVHRRIGAGGMGVVYQVFDREMNALVALKTLRQDDPVALYRFKQEFRSLANINHRNLVTLHELVSTNDQWFFTMELVDGVDFREYVRQENTAAIADTIAAAPSDHTLDTGSFGAIDSRKPPAPPKDLVRLRRCMVQLAEAVHVLHEANKLHRDLKPSNVLVTETGLVVVLDFGLVTDVDGPDSVSSSQTMVGTAAYMAPEQGVGNPVSPASDWYSVGVILYEALTGRVPFDGPPLAVVMEKQQSVPKPPRELLPSLPEDLNNLCMALLSPEPEKRPTGQEILDFLGSQESRRLRRQPTFSKGDVFIGRQKQFAELEKAFADTQRGDAITVFIHGRAGMGKSALLERSLRNIVGRRSVVLSGRCYERESVPYKALDDLIDSLAHYLSRIEDSDELAGILPKDVHAIARLFPVIRRVGSIARLYRHQEHGDPHEMRRRGTAALRELLTNLAERHPLVMTIDNLQWGDRDSMSLLIDLIRPPAPPPLLLLVAYRSEEATGSEAVRMLLRSIRTAGINGRHLIVGRLNDEETRALVASRLGEDSQEAKKYADALVAEARGNPFFIDELVRYILVGAAPADGTATIRLEEAILARIDHLSEDARRLLELVAISGRPMEQSVIADAVDLGPRYASVIALLRAGCLIRTRGTGDYDRVEIYHDRIRETMVQRLDENYVCSLHARLARALEVSKTASPEALVFHFHGAGDDERAGDHASRAADKAAEALAFDRAAELYRIAIEYLPEEIRHQRELQTKLGDALANAGHGGKAAEEYLQAAQDARPAQALELKRRAAEQLLRAGYVDEGLDTLSRVLDMVGMRMANSPQRALASLLSRRTQLRMRGLDFKERDVSQISPEELTSIDVCWSAAAGLSTIDAIYGADFQARHMLLALKAGEPYRVARALALEATYSATGGKTTWKRTQELIAAANALAARLGRPHAQALAMMATAGAEYHAGHYRRARAELEQCSALLRQQCNGVVFELVSVDRMLADVLFYLGEMSALREHVPRRLREAEHRGDLCAATDMRTGLPNAVWLAADDVDRAARETDAAMERWSQKGFHIQHYHDALARTHIALYRGDTGGAMQTLTPMWQALHNSMLSRIKTLHFESMLLRGRVLAAHAASTNDLTGLDEALILAKKLAKEPLPAGASASAVVRAAVASARGEAGECTALLETAAEGFERADMALWAAACRLFHARLVGGDEGAQLGSRQQEWMREQHIVAPERFAAMLLGIPCS